MNKTLYFICEKSEGCRLSDINITLSKGQLFERTQTVVEVSRSIRAALGAGWVRELKKSEYEKLKPNIEAANDD